MGKSKVDGERRKGKKTEAQKKGSVAASESSDDIVDDTVNEQALSMDAHDWEINKEDEEKKVEEDKKEEEQKKQGKKARKALKKALKKQVEERSESIAKSLVSGLVDGNMRSAAIVLGFMEKKKKDSGKKKKDGPSLAELLGSEEQWESETFEAMEGRSELGVGGREPEEAGDRE